jgi:hypothetical protein
MQQSRSLSLFWAKIGCLGKVYTAPDAFATLGLTVKAEKMPETEGQTRSL